MPALDDVRTTLDTDFHPALALHDPPSQAREKKNGAAKKPPSQTPADPEARSKKDSDDASGVSASIQCGHHLDRDAPPPPAAATLNAVHLSLSGTHRRINSGFARAHPSTDSSLTSQLSPRYTASPLLSASPSVPALSSASSSDLSLRSSPLSPPLSEPPSSNNTSPASHSRILLDSATLSPPGSVHTASAIKLDNNKVDSSLDFRSSTSSPVSKHNPSSLNTDSPPLPDLGMFSQGGGIQAQPPHNQTRVPHAASGKGGCWTCRIRRKKCDEQRVDDSCQTCIRLRIDCLGWGPKRPQWMRDKQAVEHYKAGIKEKLIKAGMVRGQPRTPVASSTASTSSRSGQIIASNEHAAGSSRGVTGNQHGGHSHGAHYRPYPSPHQHYASNSSMMAAASGAVINPMLGAENQHYSGLLPNLMVASGLASPDYAQEIAQEGMVRRASFAHAGLAAQQQLSMRMAPGRGSISSGANSPHGSMASPFDFSSQSSNVSPHHFQGQPLFASPDIGLGMGSLGVDMMGNSTGITPSDLNADFSLALGSTNESMIFDSNIPGDLAPQQHQMYSRLPPSRPSCHDQPMVPHQQGQASSMGEGGPNFNSALMDENFLRPHVMYYFDSVLPMQYLFQQKKAAAVIQDLLRSDPFGVLTNASCALASLHNKTLRVSRMLEQPDPVPQQSTASQLYERAFWQLANKTRSISASLEQRPSANTENHNYSISEVFGALHCVAFFLMQGGIGEWSAPLTAARFWLEKTVESAEDSQQMYSAMSDAERLAMKMTIWYDTFSAISLQQAPHFVDLCRQLLGSQQQQANIPNDEVDPSGTGVHMEELMGCPDGILLALVETAALAHWKEVERNRGSLSTRELLRRGDVIETLLSTESQFVDAQQAAGAMHDEHTGSSYMRPSRPSAKNSTPQPDSVSQIAYGRLVDSAAGATGITDCGMPSMLSTNTSGNTRAVVSPSVPHQTNAENLSTNAARSTDLHVFITSIFRETAALYLQTVINEPSASVPEVGFALSQLLQALKKLPTSASADRALTLPVALASFITNNPNQREHLKLILTTPDPSIGNMQAVRALAEQVWRRRNVNGSVVDWRVVMRELRSELLLV